MNCSQSTVCVLLVGLVAVCESFWCPQGMSLINNDGQLVVKDKTERCTGDVCVAWLQRLKVDDNKLEMHYPWVSRQLMKGGGHRVTQECKRAEYYTQVASLPSKTCVDQYNGLHCVCATRDDCATEDRQPWTMEQGAESNLTSDDVGAMLDAVRRATMDAWVRWESVNVTCPTTTAVLVDDIGIGVETKTKTGVCYGDARTRCRTVFDFVGVNSIVHRDARPTSAPLLRYSVVQSCDTRLAYANASDALRVRSQHHSPFKYPYCVASVIEDAATATKRDVIECFCHDAGCNGRGFDWGKLHYNGTESDLSGLPAWLEKLENVRRILIKNVKNYPNAVKAKVAPRRHCTKNTAVINDNTKKLMLKDTTEQCDSEACYAVYGRVTDEVLSNNFFHLLLLTDPRKARRELLDFFFVDLYCGRLPANASAINVCSATTNSERYVGQPVFECVNIIGRDMIGLVLDADWVAGARAFRGARLPDRRTRLRLVFALDKHPAAFTHDDLRPRPRQESIADGAAKAVSTHIVSCVAALAIALPTRDLVLHSP